MNKRTIQRHRAARERRIYEFHKNGFHEEWTWDVDYTIVNFTLPLLKKFKELNNGYPCELTAEEWDNILDTIIEGFEIVVTEGDNWSFDKEKNDKIEKAYELFGKWLRAMWW